MKRNHKKLSMAVAAALGLCGMGSAASAVTIVWGGGTSGNNTAWISTGNWVGGVIPGGADIAEFPATGTNPTISVGINMNSSSTNNGPNAQIVGAIALTGATNRNIINSSTVANGTLTINGVTGTLLSNTTASSTLTLANGSSRTMDIALGGGGNIDVPNADATIAISSDITSGAFDLTKSGAGVLALSGSNTFGSGGGAALTVNGGTLRSGANATSSLSGSVTINAATVDVGGSGTFGTFTLGGLTANDQSVFNFDLASGVQDSISLGGNALTLGSGTQTINVSGSGFAPGNYELIGYGSKSGGTFTLGTDPGGSFGYSLVTGATSTVLQVTSAFGSLTWTGANDNTWNTSAANWTGTATTFADGDFVNFDDSGTNTNINIAIPSVKPQAVIFTNSTIDYEFSGGSIDDSTAGPTTLTKSGDGKVTLNNSNGMTGGVGLSAGTLAIGSGAAIGSVSAVTISNGATLQAAGNVTTDRTITVSTGGATIDTNGNTMTLTTGLEGTGLLTKIGAGTLDLAAASGTYTGTGTGLIINGGTVIWSGTTAFVDNDTPYGHSPGGNSVAINDGTTLQINGVEIGQNTPTNTTPVVNLNDGGTLQGRGTSRIRGNSSPVVPVSLGTNVATVNITGYDASTVFTIDSTIRHSNSHTDPNNTKILVNPGGGRIILASGPTSSGTAFRGQWELENGILQIGPTPPGGFGEPLNALGFLGANNGNGPSRPITIKAGGTLAVAVNGPNLANTQPIDASTFRAEILLDGGAIASRIVHATYAGNISLLSNSSINTNDPVDGTPLSVVISTQSPIFASPVTNGNITWGNANLTVTGSGTARFERVMPVNEGEPTSTVSVTPGATMTINAGASVQLAGTQDALSDGVNHVNVVNNSATGLRITQDTKNVGGISGTGNTTVDAGTTLIATHIRQNHLQLDGPAQIRNDSTAAGTSKLGTVTISSSQSLDLTDNKLIVTGIAAGTFSGGQYTGVSRLVKDGMGTIVGGSPSWNGTGIITSETAAGGGNISTTLAVASAGSVGKSTLGGQPVNAGDALVMYTYNGDANLSGNVDADDYFAIDSNYNKSGSVFGFNNGDFNYDGDIDGDDYLLIDAGFSASQANPPFAAAPAVDGVTAVPEPASIGLLGLAVAGLFRRRRRA